MSILSELQQETANLFASKTSDKFDRAGWYPSATGNPIIEDAAAWFNCETQACIEAGDYHILLGRVSDFAGSP